MTLKDIHKQIVETSKIQRRLNKEFEGREFMCETKHGGTVHGIVDAIFVGTTKELDSDFKQYNIIVRSIKKNIYPFEDCYFK